MVGNIVIYSVRVVLVEVVVRSDITEVDEDDDDGVCPSTSKDARLLLYGALLVA